MFTYLQNLKKTARQGFTLLETLVAVFILTLALTGPIYIASLAIRSSVESRDNVSAYYLAEEAIEVIRNNRDTASLQNTVSTATWMTDLTGDVFCTNAISAAAIVSCVMTRDVSTGAYAFEQCTSSGCPPLSFNANSRVIYGGNASNSTDSKFTREIYIQTAPQDSSVTSLADREIEVVVVVTWVDRGRNKQLKLTERLHNQAYAQYYEE